LGRVLGVVAIATGTLIVGFNPDRFDTILFVLPLRSGHGIHLHDVLGVLLVALGTLALLVASRSRADSGPAAT